jgi:DNA-binding transcriptional LysR family regulator
MLNLTDLLAMTVVVSQGGVHAAAEKLHKTPSAISQSIKRLETGLNLIIFDRSGYRMVLTEPGLSVYNQALKLLQDAQQIESLATLLSSGQEKSYTISVSHVIPDKLYLDQISAVSDRFAGTVISIIKDGFGGPHHRLSEETADIAIVCGNSLSPLFHDTELILLGHIDLLYVIHHSLYREFNPKQNLSDWLYGLPEIKMVGDNAFDKADFYSASKHRCWWVNDLNIKVQVLRQGKGWGRLPTHCIENELESGELVPLPQTSHLKSATLETWVIRKSNRPIGVVGSQIWQAFNDIGLTPEKLPDQSAD